MKNIRQDIVNWIRFGGFVLIWIVVLYLSQPELRINVAALKKLPLAIAIYSVLHLGFGVWAWKFRIFRGWLVPFPSLQGTWQGVLRSTSRHAETGEVIESIPVILVVRQSFSSISCVMRTEESESLSNAAQIGRGEQTCMLRLSYNYTNRPRATVRDRSEIHDGAAVLRIIEKPKRALEGEYWTSRKTTGDIKLTFRTKKLLEVFPDDLKPRAVSGKTHDD